MRHVLDTLFADESGTYMQRIAAQPHLYQYVSGWAAVLGQQCWRCLDGLAVFHELGSAACCRELLVHPMLNLQPTSNRPV